MAALTAKTTAAPELVTIPYVDLVSGRNDAKIGQLVAHAFGKDGLGVLAVTDVPEAVVDERLRLLGLARRLGTLPSEVLAKYERGDLHYCAGWSRGREKFKGKVDTAKGSWYANGLWEDAANGDEALKARYPESTTEPEWPNEEVGDDLRDAFRALSRSFYEMSRHVLRHCDAAVSKSLEAKGYAATSSSGTLTAVTHERSRLHVGRLLHYYPKDDGPKASDDDAAWCGWHNDNSVITALAPAIYFDDATGARVPAPAGAGLLAFSRHGDKVRVGSPPANSVLFQIGEAAQILSGGTLIATPHAVAAGEMQGISRESFALFIEPDWEEAMQVPGGCSLDAVLAPDDARADIIPPLRSRLTEVPVSFIKFLMDSVAEYY